MGFYISTNQLWMILILLSAYSIIVIYALRSKIRSALSRILSSFPRVSKENRTVEAVRKIDESLPYTTLTLLIFGIAFIFCGQFILADGNLFGVFLYSIGIYALYRLIVEFTTDKKGVSFPNAYKIVIALIAFFAIGTVMTGLRGIAWADNAANVMDSLFNGVSGLLDYFFDHTDEIKEFIEWYISLQNSNGGSPI